VAQFIRGDVMFNLFQKSDVQKTNLETVNIDKDGIVSLNLKNEVVKDKIKKQIGKLKQFDNQLLNTQ
jgi:hypothetical protein